MAKSILDLNDDGKIDMGDIKHLLLRYEIILVGGLLLIVLPVLNAMGFITVSSDTFWVLAGVVITAEALLEIYYEKQKLKNKQFISEDEER
tara:strand:- start:1444 stop:1716 length:273 start_codon:yes stop_codon:yes gene_type:complete